MSASLNTGRALALRSALAAAFALAGCQAIVGIDQYEGSTTSTGGSGASGVTGTATVTVGTGGMGGATSMGGGGGVPCADVNGGTLTDDGVVVRYFLDEHANRAINTNDQIFDSASGQAPLLAYVEDSGLSYKTTNNSIGVDWETELTPASLYMDPGPAKMVADIKSRELTIEVVASIRGTRAEGSRIVNWGPSMSTPSGVATDLAFTVSPGGFGFRSNNGDVRLFWDTAPQATWHTYHVVVDRKEGEIAGHLLYIDGEPSVAAERVATEANTMTTAPFSLHAESEFVIGNRYDLARSLGGTIGYVAIYKTALEPERVCQHHKALAVSHDTQQ